MVLTFILLYSIIDVVKKYYNCYGNEEKLYNEEERDNESMRI